MSKLHLFRDFIRERLRTAALEIFGAVEKTFAEFQDEIYNSKEESARLKRLLDIVTPPEIKIHRTEGQEVSLPEPTQIKEEQDIKMSQLNEIRELFGEILTTAASKIYWAAEKPFTGYQEEISRSKEESVQLQRLLDIVTQPEIKLQRTDVQQLSLPEPPQIKEEQELWTSQEEEQLQGLQSETTDSIFTSLSWKRDSDQEGSVEFSHLFHIVKVEDREGDSLPTNTTEKIKAEIHVQDSAAPEPGSDSQPLSVVAPDCPAAQSLEEHGGVMLFQNRTQNNEALPRDNRPQGSHTGKTIYQCKQCNRTFRSESRLILHMRTHTGDKPFQCQQCNKQFAHKKNYVGHMKRHTVEKPFQCHQCNKTFTSESRLILHIRTHTGEKPFQCQQCNKQFSQKVNLVSHMRIHTGEKPFQCQQCNKQFAQKVNLVSHVRIHTGEKPFQCQKCNSQFSDKGNLRQHMKRHTGEKPFQCQQCHKLFTKKSSVADHMRTHTGEKPFQCQQCDERFAHKCSLVGHMRKHRRETIV
ncbi:zinc finger and SCAN domain-containing protein 2-like [Osmerus mordax]|uniref:zinc finger and SCAN domain-containing protein 2-like n=1 Tax=Osmerus mordax TaxID=8014 RepID=UPI00350FD9CE